MKTANFIQRSACTLLVLLGLGTLSFAQTDICGECPPPINSGIPPIRGCAVDWLSMSKTELMSLPCAPTNPLRPPAGGGGGGSPLGKNSPLACVCICYKAGEWKVDERGGLKWCPGGWSIFAEKTKSGNCENWECPSDVGWCFLLPFPIPFIDMDNDGEMDLTDPDQPYNPGGGEGPFDDPDGDGFPNIIDGFPEDPTNTIPHPTQGMNPGGILPPTLMDPAQFLEAFRDWLGDLGINLGDLNLPNEFEDQNEDGYLSIGEVMLQLFGEGGMMQDALDDFVSTFTSGTVTDVAEYEDAYDQLFGFARLYSQMMRAFNPEYVGTAEYREFIGALGGMLAAGGMVISNIESAISDSAFGSIAESPFFGAEGWTIGTIMISDGETASLQLRFFDENGNLVSSPMEMLTNISFSVDIVAAEPVRPGTGSYVYSVTDLEFEGEESILSLGRNYDSRSAWRGWLGYGWRMPLVETRAILYPASDSNAYRAIEIFWGNGQRSAFVQEEPGGLFLGIGPETGKMRAIYQKTSSPCESWPGITPPKDTFVGFEYRNPHGEVFQFCPPSWYPGAGPLKISWLRRVENIHGQGISFVRNSFGQPERIIDSRGRIITLEFDQEQHLLKKITGPTGRVIRYKYTPRETGKFELTKVIYPRDTYWDTASATWKRGKPFEAYRYDESELGWANDPNRFTNHNLKRISNNYGTLASIQYNKESGDFQDTVKSVTSGGETQLFQYQWITGDPYDPEVTHRTDIFYPARSTSLPPGVTGYHVERFYYGGGLLYRREMRNGIFEEDGTLIQGTKLQGQPDWWGRQFRYNDNFHLTEILETSKDLITDRLGRKTEFHYDDSNPDRFQVGNVIERRETPYPPDPDLPQIVTRFTYNPVTKDLNSITDPLNRVVRKTHNFQELSRSEIENLPAVKGWEIHLGGMPTGLNDINEDQKRGGSYKVIRTQLPQVRKEDPAGPGSGMDYVPVRKFQYDSRGRLIKTVDLAGLETEIRYQDGYPVETVIDPGGEDIRIKRSFDSLGRIVEKTLPDGQKTQVRYNRRGNVVEIRRIPQWIASGGRSGLADRSLLDRFGPEASRDILQRYGYDLLGRMVALGTPFFEGSPLADSWVQVRHYDSADRLTRLERRVFDSEGHLLEEGSWLQTYDGRGLPYSWTNPDGIVLRVERDPRLLPIKLARTTVEDPDGNAWGDITGQYNIFGEPVLVRGPVDSDANGTMDETRFQVDGYGRVVAVTSELGIQQKSTLDAAGRIRFQEVLNDEGIQVQFQENIYDDSDRILQTRIKNLKLLADGNVEALSPAFVEEIFGYGERTEELLWTVKDPDGLSYLERHEYNEIGRRTGSWVGDSNAMGRTLQYDVMGRPVRETVHHDQEDRKGPVSPSTSTILYSYGPHGHLRSVVDPDSGRTVLARDASGRIITRTDPTGMKESFGYDTAGQKRSTTQIGVDGRVRNLIQEFDILGNLTAIVDGKNQRTEYEYDDLGRLEKRILPDSTEFETRYDFKGRVRSYHRPDGGLVLYDYDAMDRMLTLSATSPDGPSVERFYEYDALSHVIRTGERTGSVDSEPVVRVFSSLGQLLSESSNRNQFEKTYDGARQSSTVRFGPGGNVFRARRDSIGRLDQISSRDQGILATVTEQYGIKGPRQITFSSGELEEWEFSANGLVLRHELLNNASQRRVVHGFTFAYDRSQNLRTRIRTTDGLREEFGYDGFQRLERWDYDVRGESSARTRTWDHDHADNPVQIQDEGGTIRPATNNLNQYQSYGNLYSDFTYRECGEEESRRRGARNFLWERDALNRPIRLWYPESDGQLLEVTFAYDARDRLTHRTDSDGQMSVYSYLGEKIHRIDTESHVEEIVYSFSQGIPLFRIRSGVLEKFQVDPTGNVVSLRDGNGNLIEAYRYDPYGKVRDANSGTLLTTGDTNNQLFFLYQPQDLKTGLCRLGARFYDPEIERFESPDPLGEEASLPLGSPHLYEYAGRNPLARNDRSGLKFSSNEDPIISFRSQTTRTEQTLEGDNQVVDGYELTVEISGQFLIITEIETREVSRIIDLHAPENLALYQILADQERDGPMPRFIHEPLGAAMKVTEHIFQIDQPERSGETHDPQPEESGGGGWFSGWAGKAFDAVASMVSTPLDALQTGLDIVGVAVPGIGDALDLVNAGISLARGDYLGASLSLAAAVPFAGIAATAGKWGRRIAAGAVGAGGAFGNFGRRSYTVYRSVDNLGVEYVGITKDFQTRAARHLADEGRIVQEIPGLQGLSRYQARNAEEALISIHGFHTRSFFPRGAQINGNEGPLGTLSNFIHSINPLSSRYNDRVDDGFELLDAAGYFNRVPE